MSEPRNNSVRALPRGSQTREELKALISKHGSVAESEVLAHINKLCPQNPWNHENFVSFFVTSGQTVFEVRNGRLHLAAVEEDSSDEEPFLVSGAVRPRISHNNAADERKQNGIPHDDTKDELDEDDTSDTSQRRIRREELPASVRVQSDSKTHEDHHRSGCAVRSKSAASPKLTTARNPPPGFPTRHDQTSNPYDSDDEGESGRLETKEAVLDLLRSRNRKSYYHRPVNVEEMVTLDPDPENRAPPKLRLGLGDSSEDSEKESENAEQPVPPSEVACTEVGQGKTNAIRGGEIHQTQRNFESTVTRKAAPRILHELSTVKSPNFRDDFFAVKEQNDFRESRERDPEKVVKDIMQYGQVSRSEAELYYNYFELLQSFNIDCMSNSQLVAGTLTLIEADAGKEMLKQLLEIAGNPQ